MKPLAIDLFCGLGGWAEGLLAEGFRVVGFDIEARPYPGSLVLQDVLTLHGSQFKDAACIVASPPCTEYSYMAMPWSRAKQIARALRGRGEFPEYYSGSRDMYELNRLFDACFRIQREASEAAGHYIPMVVENVKGAQPWVGKAKANYGSFYLWGDVDSIGGRIVRAGDVRFGAPAVKAAGRGAQTFNPDGTEHPQGSWFAIADSKNRGSKSAAQSPGKIWSDRPDDSQWSGTHGLGLKNGGGSWFNIAHNTESGVGQNPDGRKVPVYSDPRRNGGKGSHLTSPRENESGIKQAGHSGRKWFADPDVAGHFSSKSDSRKAASAQIAKIPYPLAQHIAKVFKPGSE